MPLSDPSMPYEGHGVVHAYQSSNGGGKSSMGSPVEASSTREMKASKKLSNCGTTG